MTSVGVSVGLDHLGLKPTDLSERGMRVNRKAPLEGLDVWGAAPGRTKGATRVRGSEKAVK